MADAPKLIKVSALDSMSPDERARVVREHIVTDLNQVLGEFRRRVEVTAAQLAERLDRPSVE